MLATRSDTDIEAKVPPGRGAARADRYVPETVHNATRRLLHVSGIDEAARILEALVRDLGGAAVPASLADEDAMPIDISLGEGPPVYPSAKPGTAAHWALQNYISGAVEDAHAALELTKAAERLAQDAGIDPLSGLPNHRTLSRLLTRLGPGDAIIAVDLDWINALGEEDEQGDAELLRSFARALRNATRATEYCGRFNGGEFVALLNDPGELGTTRMLERLRDRWQKTGSSQMTFSAGVAILDERGWRAAIQASDRALRRAQETGNRWETATEEDYA